MAQRFFEGEEHASLYAAFRPTAPQQLIDRIVGFLKEKYDGELDLCVDVGCGNGQCTALYASQFKQVLGTDISPAQVEATKKLSYPSNLKFQASPAESIPVGDGSVQIVNSSTACHWFDLPAFFTEASRVLCPGGIVALSAYSPRSFTVVHPDAAKAQELNTIFEKTYTEGLRPYFGKAANGLKLVLDEYVDIQMPFEESVREEVWTEETLQTLANLANIYPTLFPYINMCNIEGDEFGKQFINNFISNFKRVLGTDEEPENVKVTLKIRYFVLMGRKI